MQLSVESVDVLYKTLSKNKKYINIEVLINKKNIYI